MKYPAIKHGIIVDLPTVIEEASQNLQDFGQFQKVEFLPADFFTTITGPCADTIILSRVLHDWSDDNAIKILNNITGCLSQNGKIVIFEMIVPENTKIDMGTTLNFNLLVIVGGKERTLKEFDDILKKAGLKISDVKTGNSIISLIIAEKMVQ